MIGRVVSKFLDMCLSTLGTAAAYFEKIEVFVTKSIPWHNCVALFVDSCSVNVEIHNSIRTWLEAKYSPLYTFVYPCHFIHKAAHYGAKQLQAACCFGVEGVAVDIFYYFDNSIKRKGELQNFSEFCDIKSRKIFLHDGSSWRHL